VIDTRSYFAVDCFAVFRGDVCLGTFGEERAMAGVLDREILALAVEGLRHVGGRLRLQVYGESMLPSLWPGDTVEIAGCALEDVQPQEIVLAVRDDRVFLHRYVGRKEQARFFLRGDSMPAPDLAYPSDAFCGRLVQITRMGRSVSLPRRLSRSARAVGLLLCYCDTARRLALAVHNWRISRSSSRSGKSPTPTPPS
jgi:hypothetical protein